MSRQPACGPAEARKRARVARTYLDMAVLAAAGPGDEVRNVAAGNAVLAGIAASDALCCIRLGKRPRGQSHRDAVDMLQAISPGGRRYAADLATLLGAKEASHYGETFITVEKLGATMRAAQRLVDAAEELIATA